MMGDKLSAKQIALACDVPTTPGTTKPLESREAAQKLAMEFGFPVILKAAAGGGGRGMRRCDTVEEVGTNFDMVKAEAKKAFGNDDIFMEKLDVYKRQAVPRSTTSSTAVEEISSTYWLVTS